MLKSSTIERILRRFGRRRIAVWGDLMLDEFLRGRVSRISPEAPVPIVEVTEHTFHLGGAGNVAANISSLGGTAFAFGVVGKDEAGQRLRREFRKVQIDCRGVLTDPGRPTTLKMRVIAEHQQVVRADRERKDAVHAGTQARLLRLWERGGDRYDAIVVSDYEKWLITRELLKSLISHALHKKIPLCLDPKISHAPFYRGATLITPNHHEAERLSGMTIDNDRAAERAGKRLLRLFEAQGLLITRGEHGMTLCEASGRVTHIAARAREVFDVTGAGDTVISTLALALAAGASMVEAAFLANAAAGIVVGKLGTATVSLEELRKTAMLS